MACTPFGAWAEKRSMHVSHLAVRVLSGVLALFGARIFILDVQVLTNHLTNKTMCKYNPLSSLITTTMSNPWAKRDAWRYEGQFTRYNRFKSAFPGLGIAIVAFTGYVTFEHFFLKKDHHEEHH